MGEKGEGKIGIVNLVNKKDILVCEAGVIHMEESSPMIGPCTFQGYLSMVDFGLGKIKG